MLADFLAAGHTLVYVLGNHDTRIADSRQTRVAMDLAGWTDLGNLALGRPLGGVPSLLIGNEYPWFDRPRVDPLACHFDRATAPIDRAGPVSARSGRGRGCPTRSTSRRSCGPSGIRAGG